jgi:hypothetical protein
MFSGTKIGFNIGLTDGVKTYIGAFNILLLREHVLVEPKNPSALV